MPLDQFMNDTCPKCRKPLKHAAVKPHPTRRSLAVHKFECSNCDARQTKILFRKLGKALPDEWRSLETLSAAELVEDDVVKLAAAFHPSRK